MKQNINQIETQKQKQNIEINCISFNQEEDMVIIGTGNGFQIFNCDPFQLRLERILNGGIGIAELLYRSNIIGLVGGGINPKYALNKVMIWDDGKQRVCAELSFRSKVKNLKITLKHLIVVLEQKLFIYELYSLKLVNSMETLLNSYGIVSINSDPINATVAYLSTIVGNVSLYKVDQNNTTTLQAHKSNLSCLQLNSNASLLATASDKGTIIRIFNLQTMQLQQELRRGAEYAHIHQLSFQIEGPFLACASDSGTIHIYILNSYNNNNNPPNNNQLKFNYNDDQSDIISNNTNNNNYQDHQNHSNKQIKNKQSNLSFMKSLIPYFNSEWSFSKLRLNNQQKVKLSFYNANQVCFRSRTTSFQKFEQDNQQDTSNNNLFNEYIRMNTDGQNIEVEKQNQQEQKLLNTIIVLSYDNIFYQATFDPYKIGDSQIIYHQEIL